MRDRRGSAGNSVPRAERGNEKNRGIVRRLILLVTIFVVVFPAMGYLSVHGYGVEARVATSISCSFGIGRIRTLEAWITILPFPIFYTAVHILKSESIQKLIH